MQQNFENRLTITEVMPKTVLNRDFSIEKEVRKGSNYFSAKFKTSSARNQHQRSQNTYMRSKLHIQVKNVAKIKSLSPLLIQNSYLKSIFGIKSLFVNRFSKFLRDILRKIKCQLILKNILPVSKNNINFRRKYIITSLNTHIN